MMEVANAFSYLQILALFLLCLCATTSSQSLHRPFRPMMPVPFIPHDYNRSADVARQCQFILSSPSAAEVKVEADGVNVLMRQLSFTNGDWVQDAGQAPLMPFELRRELRRRRRAVPSRAPRVVHGHARGHGGAGAVTRCRADRSQRQRVHELHHHPCTLLPEHGTSRVAGVRARVRVRRAPRTVRRCVHGDDSGGERVLCMVGNDVLPVRGSTAPRTRGTGPRPGTPATEASSRRSRPTATYCSC
jgi:hypothetical protein